jgi:phosphohistidine phosphatase
LLVQHGEAKPETKDPQRPLTDRGHEEVRRVARYAAAVGVRVAEIRHSGKLRARQTAEILAEHLKPPKGVHVMEGLEPNADPGKTRADLEQAGDGVMLVGHLPHLARLASSLLVGDPGREIVRFRNGAIVCLVRAEGGWLVRWILTPELAGAPASP